MNLFHKLDMGLREGVKNINLFFGVTRPSKILFALAEEDANIS